jgi:hypothetical protein
MAWTASMLFAATYTPALTGSGYPSLHRGTFLQSYVDVAPLTAGEIVYQKYAVEIAKQGRKDAGTGAFYAPDGWHGFKMYIPGGVQIAVINIITYPNTTLRVHAKFKASGNNVINHLSPVSSIANSELLTQVTDESIVYNTYRYRLDAAALNEAGGGWIYFDMIEDTENFDSHFGHSVTPTVYVTSDVMVKDPDSFNAWLASTPFLANSGDPADTVSGNKLMVYEVYQPGTTTERTVSFGTQDTVFYTSLDDYSGGSSTTDATTSTGTTTSTSTSSTSSTSTDDSSNTNCPAGTYYSGDPATGCIVSGTTSTSSTSTTTGSTSGTATCTDVPDPFSDLPPCSATTTTTTSSSGTTSSAAATDNADVTCPAGYHYSGSLEVGCVADETSSSSSSEDQKSNEDTVDLGDDEASSSSAKQASVEERRTSVVNRVANQSYSIDGYFIHYDSTDPYGWIYVHHTGQAIAKLEGLNAETGEFNWIWLEGPELKAFQQVVIDRNTQQVQFGSVDTNTSAE